MEKNKITTGIPVTIGMTTIVPVLRTLARCYQLDGSLSIFGNKEPVCILLIRESAITALKTNGEEVPLEQLVQEVPNIKTVLDSVRRKGN